MSPPLPERLTNLRAQHARLTAAEASIAQQLDGVRAQRLRVEGAIDLAESLLSEPPSESRLSEAQPSGAPSDVASPA